MILNLLLVFGHTSEIDFCNCSRATPFSKKDACVADAGSLEPNSCTKRVKLMNTSCLQRIIIVDFGIFSPRLSLRCAIIPRIDRRDLPGLCVVLCDFSIQKAPEASEFASGGRPTISNVTRRIRTFMTLLGSAHNYVSPISTICTHHWKL